MEVDANQKVVAQLDVPAGNYVVWANLGVSNTSPYYDIALICYIDAANNSLLERQVFDTVGRNTYVNQALTGAVAVSTPSVLKLVCSAGTETGLSLLAQTFNLTAIRVGTLATS